MNVSNSDFDYTTDEITEAANTWAIFPHFVGEMCTCGKTANVLLGTGWFCTCGRYNAQYFYSGPRPHDDPDLGPTAEIIRDGIGRSEKWRKLAGRPRNA